MAHGYAVSKFVKDLVVFSGHAQGRKLKELGMKIYGKGRKL